MAKTAATEQALGLLHKTVAEGLTQVIGEGEAIVSEDGEVSKKSAAPAYYAAAIAFLKNNSITCSAEENAALTGLAAALAEKRKMAKAGMAVSQAEILASDYAGAFGSIQ